MKIKVTQEHIDKGVSVDADKCPIALALNAAGARHAGVTHHYCRMELDTSPKIPLPKRVSNWIAAYDCGKTVQPFEFELNLQEQ